jgi:hypothetical protein
MSRKVDVSSVMSGRSQSRSGQKSEDFDELYLVLKIEKVGEEEDGKCEVEASVQVFSDSRPRRGIKVTLFGGKKSGDEIATEVTSGVGVANFTEKVPSGEHMFVAVAVDNGDYTSNPVKKKLGASGGGGGGGKAPVDTDIEAELISETDTEKVYGLVVTFPDDKYKGVKGKALAFRKKGKDIDIVGTKDKDGNISTGRGPHEIKDGYCSVQATVRDRINKLEFQFAGSSKSKEIVLAGPKPVLTAASKAKCRRWFLLCAITLLVFIAAMGLTVASNNSSSNDSDSKDYYKTYFGVDNIQTLIAAPASGEKKAEQPNSPAPTQNTETKNRSNSPWFWIPMIVFTCAGALGLVFGSKWLKVIALASVGTALIGPAFFGWDRVVKFITDLNFLHILWTVFVPLLLAIPIYGLFAFKESIQNMLHELELKVLLVMSERRSEADLQEFKEVRDRAHKAGWWFRTIASFIGVEITEEAIMGWLTHNRKKEA